MKSTVAASTALVLALAATTASAGVVVAQHLVIHNQAGDKESDQTVMVQGHKRRVITGDIETIVDLDAGKMYFVRPREKQFVQVQFPPGGMFARMMMRQGMSIGFTKTGATHKVAGYDCQEYSGSAQVAYSNINMTECVASGAPGAREFVEFQKAMVEKLKGTPLEPKGEIPDGVPVSSSVTTAQKPYTPPPQMPPEAAKRMLDALAKSNKPTTSTTTVTKIEVKDIAADAFVVPKDYNERQMQVSVPPQLRMHPPAPGSSANPGAPATAPAPQ
jgi:hypothetical protein